jgi:hypothetical protein
LINSFSAYKGSSVVGSDGGWWLPLLAGRPVSVPPLPYTSEQGPLPDFRLYVNALSQTINEQGITSPAALAMLRDRHIDYVYLGQRQGQVNHPEGGMDPRDLLRCPAFELVYRQNRVWIFRFNPENAGPVP